MQLTLYLSWFFQTMIVRILPDSAYWYHGSIKTKTKTKIKKQVMKQVETGEKPSIPCGEVSPFFESMRASFLFSLLLAARWWQEILSSFWTMSCLSSFRLIDRRKVRGQKREEQQEDPQDRTQTQTHHHHYQHEKDPDDQRQTHYRSRQQECRPAALASSRSHSIELTECDPLPAAGASAVFSTPLVDSVFNFNERNENVLRFADWVYDCALEWLTTLFWSTVQEKLESRGYAR